MMRALFSGVTGLRSHQTRMDVIGNNIANVNTMGYKKMTTTFKDLYNETISSAASTSGVGATATGGVNAKQIGLGAAVGAISAIHTPGSAQYTGNPMDVAISGDGYFAVLTPTGIKYTRAGEFATDLTGNFVTKEGYYVLTVEPRLSASESLKVPENGVNLSGLLNQAAGIRGVAHTGNITADLEEVEGQEFSIAFEPGDEPWNIRYVGDTTDTYNPPPNTKNVVSGETESVLNVKQISELIKSLAADPANNVKLGTHEITFELDENGTEASGTATIPLNELAGQTGFNANDQITISLADGNQITATYTQTGTDPTTGAPVLEWRLNTDTVGGYTATLTGGTLALTAENPGEVLQDEGPLADGQVIVSRTQSSGMTMTNTTVSGTGADTEVAITLDAYTPQNSDRLDLELNGNSITATYDGSAWTLQGAPDVALAVANNTLTFSVNVGVPDTDPDYAARLQAATDLLADISGGGLANTATLQRPVSAEAATTWNQGSDPGLNMMYGDLKVGEASPTSVGADTTGTIVFTAVDGSGTLGQITITTEGSQTGLDSAALEETLNKMPGKPMLTLEESGEWVLKKGNVTVEKIVMEYSDNVNGGILGDVQFNTASYGSFLFDVQTDLQGNIMPNQQALSEALGGTFTITVETEYLPNYSVPAIITADSLQTLQIDFDRYTNVSIDTTGAILGQLKFDEQWEIDGQTVNMEAGDKVVLGYISMATFNNPSGLEKVGDNLFEVSANSGNPEYGTPGNGSAGSLAPSNLEMSNVDLSEEMVNMIITQRGFQANSRIITTTDTMLEELVNLKR